MTFSAKVRTPFAVLGIETDDRAVTAIRYLPLHERPSAPRTPTARRAVAQLERYFDDPAFRFTLPLTPRGTAFQQRVWQALREIPAGRTVSYTQVAHRIGAPSSVRAVAQAIAANQLAVAIPCHRVIRTDGALSGYRWGVERKRALLKREARH